SVARELQSAIGHGKEFWKSPGDGADRSLAAFGHQSFNYIDRYILAAVLPQIKHDFLAGDPNQNAKAGSLGSAFLISYMCAAPILGWLADRVSRWWLVGVSVALWSLASGWSGLAASFAILLCTRAFVGIGEAGYGP